jgi:exodeoxyribonuclease V alpha subunit
MDLFERMRGRPGADSPGGGPRAQVAADGRAPPREEPPEETIEGTIERIAFTGADGAFVVARLAVDGAREPVTVVGALTGIPVGARVRVTGRREHNPRFGPQFKVAGVTEVAPATMEGIRRYLGSGLIKGIGPEFATRIVSRFGIQTLEILDREPARIIEVPGIGPSRARSIREAWTAQREVRKVMVFLQGYGVSPAFAARIYKRYRGAAIALVRENPYRLAFDVWGIGFLSADKLASALGIARESDVRVEAGVRHVLEEASTAGDVFVPRARLCRKAAALLEVEEPLAEAAIGRLGRSGELVIEARPEISAMDDGEAIYVTALYQAEASLAAGLARLRKGGDAQAGTGAPALTIDVERAVAWYEKQAGIALAPQQAEAVRQALREDLLVVTGGPGVGKTTIVRGIVAILGKKGLRVGLAAPTGRAAKRLSEATGQPALTLHRLLEWRPAEGAFGRRGDRPLEVDALVVDEASMLDVRLGADLLAALATGTRLILVGDVDQLPSVGPGTVLRDVIESGVVPTVRLTEIFRQAGESLIVVNAHRIHQGLAPELGAAPADGAPTRLDRRDFFFLEEADPVRAAELIRDLVVTRLPRKYGLAVQDVQVLTPMHRGELGAANLNHLIQTALTSEAPGLARGGRTFRVGDKVMQVRNDYEKDVFNGDIGHVQAVTSGAPGKADTDAQSGVDAGVDAAAGGDRSSEADGGDALGNALIVRFDDREVTYGQGELDELQLAYAATIHKSQGSEYPAVVIPIHTQHFVMLQRNLLYTAVTRARRLVVLVGTRKALSLAVRNADVEARGSRLDVRLRAALPAPAGLPVLPHR